VCPAKDRYRDFPSYEGHYHLLHVFFFAKCVKFILKELDE